MTPRQQELALLDRRGVDGTDVVIALHANIECDRCHSTLDRVMRFAGKLELCIPCVQLLCYHAREVK